MHTCGSCHYRAFTGEFSRSFSHEATIHFTSFVYSVLFMYSAFHEWSVRCLQCVVNSINDNLPVEADSSNSIQTNRCALSTTLRIPYSLVHRLDSVAHPSHSTFTERTLPSFGIVLDWLCVHARACVCSESTHFVNVIRLTPNGL